MAQLFEEVAALLESRSSTRALAARFRIESQQAAANGAVLGVPVYISELLVLAGDAERADSLLKTLRSVQADGLHDPGACIESGRYEPLGTKVANKIFGDRRRIVGDAIAAEAGVSRAGANGLLAVAGWALLVALVDRHGNRMDRSSLLTILGREYNDLVDRGWGPWLEEAGQVAPKPHRYGDVEDYQLESEPVPVEVGDASRIPMIMAGVAVGLVGLLGLFQFLGSDGDASATESADPASQALQPVGGDGTADFGVDPDPNVVALQLFLSDPTGQVEAGGSAELRFNPTIGEVCYNVAANGLSGPFDAHIHASPAGQPGEIVVDLRQLEGGDIGCVAGGRADLAAMLADRSGYYLDFHDPDDDFVVRAFLADGTEFGAEQAPEDEATDQLAAQQYDANGTGAGVRVESGRLVLTGEVADGETRDRMVEEYADIAGSRLAVVNQLQVLEGAPLPSGRITLDNAGLFAVGSDRLATDRGTVLADLAAVLLARPEWTVTVVGHTDSSGSEQRNLQLSEARATAVLDDLVAQGVAAEKLSIIGAGSSQPVADNSTSEGQALNRRIELIVDRG